MIERGDRLIGDAEAEGLGLLAHDRLGDEVGEHLLVEAEACAPAPG